MRRKSSSEAPTSSTAEGAAALQRIRRAGVDLFSRYGYHGTSMRTLADAVHLEAASIYHHFPSKQDILADIFDRTMDELLDGAQRALGGEGSHAQRLCEFVLFHVLYHVDRQKEAFISHSELRSLTPANRARVNDKRDRYERTLRSFLESGVEAGEFRIHDIPIMTIAVLMMCSGVSDWFTDHGRLSGEQIAEEHTRLVLQLVQPGGAGGSRQSTTRRGSGSMPGPHSPGHDTRRRDARGRGHRPASRGADHALERPTQQQHGGE
jgi:AcrR family transcriptional regulator